MQISNNTSFSLDEINSFPHLATTVNKWRGREIVLRQHPTESDNVISIGTTLDNTMQVICKDSKSSWTTALEYWSRGKVYISE